MIGTGVLLRQLLLSPDLWLARHSLGVPKLIKSRHGAPGVRRFLRNELIFFVWMSLVYGLRSHKNINYDVSTKEKQMDALEFLKHDHQAIRELLEQAESTKRRHKTKGNFPASQKSVRNPCAERGSYFSFLLESAT